MQENLGTFKAIAIVFLAGACTMVIELVAGRILAPHVGVSIYTWTSIIGKALSLDHLTHSLVDPNDPTFHGYDYEKTFSAVARFAAGDGRDLGVLCIGGGGYSFSRFLEVENPAARIEVIEIDLEVTRIVTHIEKETFRGVYLVQPGGGWGLSTYVVIATNRNFGPAELVLLIGTNRAEYATGVLMTLEEVERAAGPGEPLVLTDDYVPVDNMIAPFFKRG